MVAKTSFNGVAQVLMDRWLAANEGDTPEALHAGLPAKLNVKMALNLVHLAADPMEWRLEWVKAYGFKTKLLDFGRLFPQGRFGDLPDQTYLQTSVLPAYRAAIEGRKPRLDLVTAQVAGLAVGYERLLLPQRGSDPAWCLSFTEGRFMLQPPPIAISSDETDQAIAQLLIEGQTAREISPLLALSQRTIEHRIDRMKQRYDARNVTHLISKLVSERLHPMVQLKSHPALVEPEKAAV